MNINISEDNMFYTFFAYQGFSLNTNFLEANVINIVILFSGLVYLLKQSLGSLLITRQQKVLGSIQEAEDRLAQANERLLEAEKQFKQTEIVMQQIQQEAVITAAKVRNSILDQGKLDIERLTEAGKASLAIAERQVREQIQSQITNLAIRQVIEDLKQQITPITQSKIVDHSIMQLGDKYDY